MTLTAKHHEILTYLGEHAAGSYTETECIGAALNTPTPAVSILLTKLWLLGLVERHRAVVAKGEAVDKDRTYCAWSIS